MSKVFQVAIIGSGPAGLSAAGRAAQYDIETNQSEPTHVLLEGFNTHSKTIYRYQKGKHVMAEPGFLALRSPMQFEAGKREQILDSWDETLKELNINIRFDSEVKKLARNDDSGQFSIGLQDGSEVLAESVVLAIGFQGNPRRLGVDGDAESDFVMYQLDDPEEFKNETIVVVGAGDAAIENAIGLLNNNTVYIVNRKAEFSRAKEGNLNNVLAAINDKKKAFYCKYETNIAGVELPSANGELGAILLNTPEGEVRQECHRIIARLGAIPPRSFVESCGIEFPNDKPDAIPDLDRHYQSNIPGLYIIGALGGYPLIKQAMNQGHDVIEFIRGVEIKPADYPLLQKQFRLLPYAMDAEDVLDLYQKRVPMFRRMNALSFRELLIESNIMISLEGADYDEAVIDRDKALQDEGGKLTKLIKAGEYIYRDGEYSNSFYTLVEGSASVQFQKDGPSNELQAGQFFGEMSLLSGRPRQGNAVAKSDCILIETPRRIMVKLMNSNDDVREGIDRVFIMRALELAFKTSMPSDGLGQLASQVELKSFKAGETLYSEGEEGDYLDLIRSGTVVLVQKPDDVELVLSQLQSGDLVGQMALMGTPIRQETAKAAVRVESIRINKKQFLKLVGGEPDNIDKLQTLASEQLRQSRAMASYPEGGKAINFLMDQGLGESTNALIIDEALCVGCDNCEKACADTHGGISRLDRATGASYAQIHVPVSCRHCEQPHCMKDCPADAIHRSGGGEVFIDSKCIGCGNCETNCPYDVIKLTYEAPKKPSLLSWLFLGAGHGPGEPESFEPSTEAKAKGKKAVKCDACMNLSGGPACVRACPTGAAIRLGPDQFGELVGGR